MVTFGYWILFILNRKVWYKEGNKEVKHKIQHFTKWSVQPIDSKKYEIGKKFTYEVRIYEKSFCWVNACGKQYLDWSWVCMWL